MTEARFKQGIVEQTHTVDVGHYRRKVSALTDQLPQGQRVATVRVDGGKRVTIPCVLKCIRYPDTDDTTIFDP